jgi:hypothetical protein
MLFQKWFASTSRRKAFFLSLRALPEGAEPAEIVVPALAEQENIDLMVSDADAALLVEIVDRPAAGAIESRQIVQPVNGYGEI